MSKLSYINGLDGKSEQSILNEIQQRTAEAKPRPYFKFSKLSSAEATRTLVIDHFKTLKSVNPEDKALYNKALDIAYKYNPNTPRGQKIAGVGVIPTELNGLMALLDRANNRAHLPAINRKAPPKVNGEISPSGYDTNFNLALYAGFSQSSLWDEKTSNAMTADAHIFLPQYKGGGQLNEQQQLEAATDATNSKLNQTGTATGQRRPGFTGFDSLAFTMKQAPSWYQQDRVYNGGLISLYGPNIKRRVHPDTLPADLKQSIETMYPGLWEQKNMQLHPGIIDELQAIYRDQFYINMASEQDKYRLTGPKAYERLIEAMNLAGVYWEHAFDAGNWTTKQTGQWLIKRGQETNFNDYLHAPIYEKYVNTILTDDTATTHGLYGFIPSSKHFEENRMLNGNDLTTATALKMQAQTGFLGGLGSFTGIADDNIYLMSRTGIVRKIANEPDQFISNLFKKTKEQKIGEPISATIGTIIAVIALIQAIKALTDDFKKDAKGISPTSVPPALLGLNPATSRSNPGVDFGLGGGKTTTPPTGGGKKPPTTTTTPGGGGIDLKNNTGLIYGAGAVLLGLLYLNK